MADCEGDCPAEPPPAGFDAVDLDMIKSGDRLGPALGRRVFDALSRATRAEERIAEMEAAAAPILALVDDYGAVDEDSIMAGRITSRRGDEGTPPRVTYGDFVRLARAIRTRGE